MKTVSTFFLLSLCFHAGVQARLQDQIEHFTSNNCDDEPFATSNPVSYEECGPMLLWGMLGNQGQLFSNLTSFPDFVRLSVSGLNLEVSFYQGNENFCSENSTVVGYTKHPLDFSGCCIPIAEQYSIRVASFRGAWTKCDAATNQQPNFGSKCFSHSDCNWGNSVCMQTNNWSGESAGYCESCLECTGYRIEGREASAISSQDDCPARCKELSPCFGKSHDCVEAVSCSSHNDCLAVPNQYCVERDELVPDSIELFNQSAGSCENCSNCTSYDDWWNGEATDLVATSQGNCPPTCNPEGPCFLKSVESCICTTCIRPRVLLLVAICMIVVLLVTAICIALVVRRTKKQFHRYRKQHRVYGSLLLSNCIFILFVLAEKSKDNWAAGPLLPCVLGTVFAQLYIFSVPVLSLESFSCCASQLSPWQTNVHRKDGASQLNSFSHDLSVDSAVQSIAKTHKKVVHMAWVCYCIGCALTLTVLVQGAVNLEYPTRGVLVANGLAGSLSVLIMGIATHFANLQRVCRRADSSSELHDNGASVSSLISGSGSFRVNPATVKPLRPKRAALGSGSDEEKGEEPQDETQTRQAQGDRTLSQTSAGSNSDQHTSNIHEQSSHYSISSIPVQLREHSVHTPGRTQEEHHPMRPNEFLLGNQWQRRPSQPSSAQVAFSHQQHNNPSLTTAVAHEPHSGGALKGHPIHATAPEVDGSPYQMAVAIE